MFKTNIAVLFMMLLSGCSCVTKFCDPPMEDPNLTLTILEIKSSPSTNEGTPLYVVIKSTDFGEFLVDDYQKVSELILPSEVDPKDSMVICIIPGKTQKIRVDTHRDKSLAIFCLFTKPQEVWKSWLDPKEGYRSVSIVLGDHQIESIKMW